MQQVASQNAPSPYIVLPHFVFGGAVWLLVTLLIIVYPEAFTQHYFNQKLLAITHLLALGWITIIIFGTLYQLVPVVMETKLFSEKLALATFVLLAVGAVLLSHAFWQFHLGLPMHIAAGMLLIAVLLFALNIFVTGSRSSKRAIEKDFIQTSVVWLLFTVIAGITLAINLTHPFITAPHIELLKLHAHAGIIGWFVHLIIGVGSKLLPMFLVSHQLNKTRLTYAYFLLNSGLVVSIGSLYFQWFPGIVVSVALVIAGLSFFILFLVEAFRKRVKKHLDTGMKQSALAFLLLCFPIILIVFLLVDPKQLSEFTLPMTIAYGATLMIGFLTSLIMGQTYKTLPFIVWLKVYKSRIGKIKTPFPKELYSRQAAQFQLWSFASGFGFLLAGILSKQQTIISIGGGLLLLSALLYNFNIWKTILHQPSAKNEHERNRDI